MRTESLEFYFRHSSHASIHPRGSLLFFAFPLWSTLVNVAISELVAGKKVTPPYLRLFLHGSNLPLVLFHLYQDQVIIHVIASVFPKSLSNTAW